MGVDIGQYIVQGGPWALIGTGLIAILKGRLVPAKTMESRMRDKDERIEDKKIEADRWRKAYEASEESRKTSEAQVDQLLEQGRTTNILLTTLTDSKSGGGQ